jgi:hypothetical protein
MAGSVESSRWTVADDMNSAFGFLLGMIQSLGDNALAPSRSPP